MIEHLRGREKALEQFGWRGREAEWIALVCLHSGIFTRAQFCFYFFNAWRNRAQRFVELLVDQGFASEVERPIFSGGALACRIFSKKIYRALGAEDIRHRKDSGVEILWRRLLSLDYVLEHPGLRWLPTEQEKVGCFEALGLGRGLLPRRVYRRAGKEQTRYFALKFPVAVDSETATFAYVDPGNETATGLRSWGDAHRRLWGALRDKGLRVQVVAIGRDHQATGRAEAVLRWWANGAVRGNSADPSAAQEIERIEQAIRAKDQDILRKYGGLNPAIHRHATLKKLPAVKATNGSSIDGYSTWWARRLTEADEGL